ncbi:mutT-like protein [Minicystis rosea]|nr:mutT-like protein [Minicystis rosea]
MNPLPVAVVIVPILDEGGELLGILGVRRGIEPQKGKVALPGGFIEVGETWQAAGAREVFEETGIRIDPSTIRDFAVLSSLEGHLLVFGLAAPLAAASLGTFVPTDEASERPIIVPSMVAELAFPLHVEAAGRYFRSQPM